VGRRRLLALCLCVLASAAALAARQDWHDPFVASFDAAWQTVDETFVDPTFGGLDWPAVRTELRPRVQSAASPDAARAVISEMLARLRRSHYSLLTGGADAMPGDAIVPIDVRVIDGDVVMTRVFGGAAADRAVLAPGARILSIDGELASTWAAKAAGPDARSRALDVWRRATRALHGVPGSVARLRVRLPDGRESAADVARVQPAGERIRLGNLPPLDVAVDAREATTPGRRRAGVIAFNLWMASAAAGIDEAVDRFRDRAGLVIDLRGNPGGLVLMISGVAGHVLADPVVLGEMKTRTNTLTLRANPRLSTADGRRVAPFAGPVAILVDELTASASECFAGALQGLGRARVFGTQTMGQALPASTRTLPSGDVLLYAIGDFVTASGRRLEGDGVVPDEPIRLSIERLAAGGDPALDAALRWIDRQSP
jgi:carboxyl-terminal processing protease